MSKRCPECDSTLLKFSYHDKTPYICYDCDHMFSEFECVTSTEENNFVGSEPGDWKGLNMAAHEMFVNDFIDNNESKATEHLQRIADVVEDKHSDYGELWMKETIIRRVLSEDYNEIVELDDGRTAVVIDEGSHPQTLQQEVMSKTWTGLFNKIGRAYRLTFVKDNDVEGEPLEDAYDDLLGYAANLRAQVDEYEGFE